MNDTSPRDKSSTSVLTLDRAAMPSQALNVQGVVKKRGRNFRAPPNRQDGKSGTIEWGERMPNTTLRNTTRPRALPCPPECAGWSVRSARGCRDGQPGEGG